MVGRRHVVFQAHHKLYLAPLNGIERPAAHREEPLGWTENGFYTYSYLRRELLLRSMTGRLLAVIARAPFHAEYPVSKGTLFFVADGVVVKAHGTRVRPLRSLRSLGFTSDTFIEPVGPLLELLNNHQAVLLRANGSVYGRISSPSRISSSLSIAPRASAVAFTVASGKSETLELLRPNGRPPVQLHHQAIASPPPYQLTNLQWHGSWLLYSDSDQHALAAVNIRRPQSSIEMTGLVRRLLHRLTGPFPGFDAYWAEQPHD